MAPSANPPSNLRRASLFASSLLVLLKGPKQAAAGWVDPDSAVESLFTQAFTRGDDRHYELVSVDRASLVVSAVQNFLLLFGLFRA